MPHSQSYFHLHLVSDATGETLRTVARAASAQYANIRALEHNYPLIRTAQQLERVIAEIESSPGIVLYTLVNKELSEKIENRCKEIGTPCINVIRPVLECFQSYLGTVSAPRMGAQHVLDADYFKRIDALNYTMIHDDGQLPEGYDKADVILVGVSRTSKTPTSIYLANRGLKTANIPLVPNVPLPHQLDEVKTPLVVGLIASPERIVQIRQNRLLTLNATQESTYVDRHAVNEEIANSKRLFNEKGWPMIDVTRRSIEETAAAILELYETKKYAAVE